MKKTHSLVLYQGETLFFQYSCYENIYYNILSKICKRLNEISIKNVEDDKVSQFSKLFTTLNDNEFNLTFFIL